LSEPNSREKATLGWPFSLALNHLLDRERWAREKLAAFADQVLEVRAPPLPALRFTISSDGRLQAGGVEPSLVVTLRPEIIPALARGSDHALRTIQVSGNAQLANEVMFLARHLRWDVEEDLSRLLGDVAAHRLAQAARDFLAWQADAAKRIAETAADYAGDESRVLLRRTQLASFAGEVTQLRDAIERLEQRIRRLG
jgi:ubiquinone biosynthesis accessory factor UbiJ